MGIVTPLSAEAAPAPPPAHGSAARSAGARRRWLVAPAAPDALRLALPTLHPVVVQVLHARGLSTPEMVRGFLHAGAPHDPMALHGMDRAIARLRRAIERGETVAAHGDFDVDGVSATAVLVEGLAAAGLRVIPYIPERSVTGYGFHVTAVERLAAQGVGLIVTGDTGTRAIEAVDRAAALGIDVIVTDHHLPGDELPAAHALINPHHPACSYPFKDLSGCGVAWKLIQGLASHGLLGDFDPDQLLDLVALGTIADVSPLIGENRLLVRRGLRRLAAAPRPGVDALLAQAAGAGRTLALDERTVAFSLGPRLNAAGRMGSAGVALDLLLTRDAAQAHALGRALDTLNVERQRVTEKVVAEARAQAERSLDRPALVVRGRDWPSGVIGLVAARLAEEYRRPAFVVEVGDDTCRGSARSAGGIDLVAALGECGELLIEFGGHAQAAGFAARPQHLDALTDRLMAVCGTYESAVDSPLVADCRLVDDDLDWSLYRGLSVLRPFGEANAPPLFLSERLELLEARGVGAGGAHLRARVRLGRQVIGAFGPNLGEHARGLAAARAVDALYSLEASVWNGRESLELRLNDVRASEPATANCG